MADENYALMQKSRLPTYQQWQTAITANGFDFQLDPTLNLLEDEGYIPGKLGGHEAGFELYFTDSVEALEELRELAPDADCCLIFRSASSRMLDCAATMIALYILTKDFGAVVSHAGEPPLPDLEIFHQATNECIAAAGQGRS